MVFPLEDNLYGKTWKEMKLPLNILRKHHHWLALEVETYQENPSFLILYSKYVTQYVTMTQALYSNLF